MEMNALKALLDVTIKSRWYPTRDFILMVGYYVKLAGHEWETDEELNKVLHTFNDAGVIEMISPNEIRFKEELYDALTI